MLAKKERVPRLMFTKRPTRTGRFLYGSIKEFSGPPAAAVVVSKKVCKTAPMRNRTRRRVYSIVRGLLRRGIVKKTIIIFPTKDAATAPFQDLQKELERVLS